MAKDLRLVATRFVRSAGKLLDLGNTRRPFRPTLKRGENIRRSWENVGRSMDRSLRVFERETPNA